MEMSFIVGDVCCASAARLQFVCCQQAMDLDSLTCVNCACSRQTASKHTAPWPAYAVRVICGVRLWACASGQRISTDLRWPAQAPHTLGRLPGW